MVVFSISASAEKIPDPGIADNRRKSSPSQACRALMRVHRAQATTGRALEFPAAMKL
jgi:hypothetical protein